jgi:hypothetical protein
MQHFLASRQFIDIPIKHLFVEYKFWIERERPFENVTAELATLARQRDHFRRIVAPEPGDVVFELANFLERFDIRTVYPLMLFLLDSNLPEGEWKAISVVLESYLLRRAVLGWTTKAYNRIFLILTRAMKAAGPSAKNLETVLVALSGESSAWPTDTEFSEAWLTANAYEQLNSAKLGHILRRISNEHLSNLSERITINSPLTIEHLLPQSWVEHWPLPGGLKGLSHVELLDADSDDARVVASRRRNALLQTMGNLTILTQALNSTVSNSAWAVKKPELLKASLLPLNQQLHEYETWEEATIEKRGKALLEKALKIWPRPGAQPV